MPRDGGWSVRALVHLRLAARTSAPSTAVAFVAGSLLRLLLPVDDAWLAGATAAATAAAGLLCIALARPRWADGGRRPPLPQDAEAAIEAMGTAEQVGHAFLRAALVLAGLAAGLWLSGLAGLGRA